MARARSNRQRSSRSISQRQSREKPADVLSDLVLRFNDVTRSVVAAKDDRTRSAMLTELTDIGRLVADLKNAYLDRSLKLSDVKTVKRRFEAFMKRWTTV